MSKQQYNDMNIHKKYKALYKTHMCKAVWWHTISSTKLPRDLNRWPSDY